MVFSISGIILMLGGLYDVVQAVLAYLYMPLSLSLMYQDIFLSTARSMQLRITVLMILIGVMEIITGYLLKKSKGSAALGCSILITILWSYIVYGKETAVISLKNITSMIHIVLAVIFTIVCCIFCMLQKRKEQS
ncbi:MAG: hypothetical protein PUA69_08160 [Erysipelotrichaceae bacterium]|nr:hypothetical protein [Erysipelotrichaceae bacterium]